MDIVKLIKEQIERITKFEESIFLDSIILHLERAEYYYELGGNCHSRKFKLIEILDTKCDMQRINIKTRIN